MEHVIEYLSQVEGIHRRLSADTELGPNTRGLNESKANDFAQAASILRSYPGAVKAKAEPAEPLPTIYVGFEWGEAVWFDEAHDGAEIAPDYVAEVAHRMLKAPEEGENDPALCAEMTAALARWEEDSKPEKPVFRTKEETEKLDGMFREPTQAERLQAAREMGDDPRFLKLLVLALTSRLDALSDSDMNSLMANADAANLFNTLFPKP